MQETSDNIPITTDELLACIGEMYVQVRVLRRILANQKAGLVNGAIGEERPLQSQDN